MRITNLNVPATITEKQGLQPINMTRLENVVVIAGKNGAGKTRSFQLLKELIGSRPSNAEKEQLQKNLLDERSHLHSLEAIRASLIGQSKTQDRGFVNQLNEIEQQILNSEKQLGAYRYALSMFQIVSLMPDKQNKKVIDFVPKKLNLKDSYDIAEREITEYAGRIYIAGTNIAESVIPAIYQIQRRYFNIQNDEDLSISSDELEKIKSQYQKLRNYIKTFLGTDLKRDSDGQPMLFEKRIGQSQLSDGQKILLQFCLAIYAQESSLEDLIIFMDEPENHLHPGALIYVLDTLLQRMPNGQLWISTHSINVLAHFDPSYIWYIEEGKISYAGNIPRTVLKSLMGSEDEIEKLSSFLSLPAEMASAKFAYESLFYPQVLITGPDDPQINQIKNIIDDFKTQHKKLKVLDFGVGKARLLSTIFENERLAGNEVARWLDMYGYDKDQTYNEICTKVFENVYANASKRYYNEAENMLIDHDAKSFDLIVMTNVLHEIDPKDWVREFNSTHSVFNLLKDDGYLLIVEDQFLAVGEKAHSKGFLVLDTLELRTLFGITAKDDYIVSDYRKDGRLKAHYIPKACLSRITSQSRQDALKSLLESAKGNIKKIRQGENSYKSGKLHGFWAQQLANASLALEEL